MQRILITGGSGFIGMNLIGALKRAGIAAVNLATRPPRCAGRLDSFIKADVTRFHDVATALSSFEPTTVIHLAARTAISRREDCDYSVNVEGARILLQALAGSRSVERALFASSMVVGWPGERRDNNRAADAYLTSKIEMEKLVAAAPDMRCARCIVRPVSTWGPWFGSPFHGFFRSIESRRYRHLPGADTPKRLSYVGNAVFQLIQLAEARPELIDRKTLYLGDYEPTTVRQWANAIGRAFGLPEPWAIPAGLARAAALAGDLAEALGVVRDAPLTSRRIANMQIDTSVFPIDAIRSIAGPLPYTLEDGVRETVQWLRSPDHALTGAGWTGARVSA
jgi:nucleoside-diphosphate-sugar epimerase